MWSIVTLALLKCLVEAQSNVGDTAAGNAGVAFIQAGKVQTKRLGTDVKSALYVSLAEAEAKALPSAPAEGHICIPYSAFKELPGVTPATTVTTTTVTTTTVTTTPASNFVDGKGFCWDATVKDWDKVFALQFISAKVDLNETKKRCMKVCDEMMGCLGFQYRTNVLKPPEGCALYWCKKDIPDWSCILQFKEADLPQSRIEQVATKFAHLLPPDEVLPKNCMARGVAPGVGFVFKGKGDWSKNPITSWWTQEYEDKYPQNYIQYSHCVIKKGGA